MNNFRIPFTIFLILVVSCFRFLNAQSRNISLQAGINTTDKNSSDLEGMGFGGTIDVLIGINKYVEFTIETGYSIQNLANDHENLSMIPILGGLRINLHKLKIISGEKYIMPYIGAGLGCVIPRERKMFILNDGGLACFVLAGALYSINKNFGFDFNIKMNGYYWGTSDHSSYGDVLYCLNAGIYFSL
jgi:hypothetical protein